jgi:hypothetical protein
VINTSPAGVGKHVAAEKIPSSNPSGKLFWLIAIGLLLAATFLAYKPVLADFLTGDDYAYLPWCKMAMTDPGAILVEFHRPWMNNFSNAFYRPMLTVSMALDYRIWGPGGFGFHLSNFIYLLVSSTLCGFIVYELAPEEESDQVNKQQRLSWAIASGGLFALYPLHPEAISWMTGRVDCFTTMFILGSLWCYIQWRKNNALKFIAIGILSMAIALMSKESAITIPVLITLYEFWLGDPGNDGLVATVLRTVKKSLPFWIALAAYFIWRRIALGTFIGGYDNSLFITDWQALAARWSEGLKNLVVPLNSFYFGAHSLITKAWYGFLATSIVCFIVAAVKNPQLKRTIAFLICWTLASFIPVYKIFTLNGGLQGGRLVYLVTVPLCILLTFGFAFLSHRNRVGAFQNTLIALTMSLACFVLYTNNLAWAASGEITNKIKSELNQFYTVTSGDPPVLIAGLPNSYLGAHCCVNAQDGLTKFPQINRDIFNCYKIDEDDPFFPFGYLKNSILLSGSKLLFWDQHSEKLKPVSFAQSELSQTEWRGDQLKNIVDVLPNPLVQASFGSSGLVIKSDSTPNKRPAIIVKIPNLSCWRTDFIAMKLRVGQPGDTGIGADLLYKNEILNDFELAYRLHATIDNKEDSQEVIFPLRSRATWAFGGVAKELEIRLPAKGQFTIEAISLPMTNTLLPKIGFPNSDLKESRGILHFDSKHPGNQITFDLSNLEGATNAHLEITKLSQYFEEQNTRNESKVLMRTITSDKSRGTFALNRLDFPSRGFYQARIKAFDAAGKQIGLSSDYISLSID